MSGGKRVILTEAELSKVYEKIDLAFLRHLLRLIPDHVAMRDNTALAHTNARNLIRGFQFSAFIFRTASRNGSPRLRSLARQLVGLIPRFCHWSPLILYSHCVDKLHILLHFTADKEQDLM